MNSLTHILHECASKWLTPSLDHMTHSLDHMTHFIDHMTHLLLLFLLLPLLQGRLSLLSLPLSPLLLPPFLGDINTIGSEVRGQRSTTPYPLASSPLVSPCPVSAVYARSPHPGGSVCGGGREGGLSHNNHMITKYRTAWGSIISTGRLH